MNCYSTGASRNAPATMESPEFVPESSEIGSLTAHSNEDSQFVGSSSGVYFINTVKRAFSNGLDASGSSTADFPTAEDTLVGAEDLTRAKRPRTASSQTDHALSAEESESPAKWTYDPAVAAALGSAPPLNLAKDLMIMYFKVWHPLFPFLHGPTFLQAMQSLYSSSSSPKPSAAEPPLDHHRSSCWTTILQCVFNLGSLLRPELPLSPACKIQSPASISSLLGSLSSCHDIMSLQALLAAQVYLVAIMSLRPASTVGGCVLRCMFHAGLHRCPFRYRELSSHDRQLRKRIFWCAYAIDRYLSQALGLPLGIQDSDIDVCLPAAREIHSPRRTRSTVSDTQAANTAMAGYFEEQQPSEHETNGAGDGQPSRSVHRATGDEHQSLTPGREGVLASYVGSGTLTGRALELFHKSILVRSVRRSSVLFLVTDVHKWWNNLPLDLQGKNIGKKHDDFSTTDISFDFGPFFTVLYQHLILIIHRPSLSIDPSTAEFCSGLQTCIGAARAILFALRAQVASRQALFWPGFLSAAWMSGLVLAFACQLNQYVLAKGLQYVINLSLFSMVHAAYFDQRNRRVLRISTSHVYPVGNSQAVPQCTLSLVHEDRANRSPPRECSKLPGLCD